jgi:ATP-dependent Clp protease ATP-binding subunit ClpC
MGELKKVFRPEFLNRIDDVIVFHKLQKEEIKEIVELLLLRIRGTMAERELQLELTEPAKDMLVDKGWDPAMGARPLRRAIQRYVEDPLADFVLREELTPGATVVVNPPAEGQDEQVRLTVVKPKKPKKTPVGVGGRGEQSEELATEELVPEGLGELQGDLGGAQAPGVGGGPQQGEPSSGIDERPEGGEAPAAER